MSREFTAEHCANIKRAKAGKHHGKGNPNWRGGDWANHKKAKGQAVNAKKIADRHGVENTLTFEEWLSLLEEHNYRCAYCFSPSEELDHVISMSRGGANTKENVVPSCRFCNRRKHGSKEWVPSIASKFWPAMAEERYA